MAHFWQSVPTTRFDAVVRSRLSAEAKELLEAQAALLRKAGAEVAVAHLSEAPAVDGVLDLAGEIGADLVVLGSRGPVKRIVLGSVSEGVVHQARCPVLVLRGGSDAWPPRHVVVGEDGSGTAARAASLAAGIGGLFGARGLVLRAYPELPETDLEGRSLNAHTISDYEGFGLVVSETLWKGTPMVAGEAGGIPMQMPAGTGGFPVGSVEECAEKLLYLLRNPGEGVGMARRWQGDRHRMSADERLDGCHARSLLGRDLFDISVLSAG